METVQQKAIVYDDNCPLCSLYTKGFVRWGLLQSQNRIPFSQIETAGICHQLDTNQARHEIPLVDLAGGRTLYGPEALVFLLSQKLPFLENIMQWPSIRKQINSLYQLISYNRRVIIPASPAQPGTFDCAPDFNRKYRIRFIYVAVFVACLLNYAFGVSLERSLGTANGGTRMLLIGGSSWVLHIMPALLFLKQKRLEYVGQLTVIMVIGALSLVPGILLCTFWNSPWVSLASVLLSSSLMLHQHLFRVRHLQLSQRWTWLWFLILQITAAACIYILFLN